MPLTPDEATDVVRDLWALHRGEITQHDRAYGYLRGLYGVPDVPEGASEELKVIARDSVLNVLSIVIDVFSQGLGVNGFRSPDSTEDDAAWSWWQEQRLDARQQDAHRPALTYGTAYGVLDADANLRLRTPRQMLAVYADPLFDLWPIYALETWVDYTDRRPVRRGRLYDDEAIHLLDLGQVVIREDGTSAPELTTQQVSVREVLDTTPHGAEVCPVGRFVNRRDAEDVVAGEVHPLIRLQRAINAANYDRLVVARFGAFPQRYAIGWMPETADELVRASMERLLAFEDDRVKVGAFPAASVEPYNSLLSEQVTHLAMQAQIPLSAFGSMINLSAEALAMAEAPYQRKLVEKRESFGETWEQLIRLAAKMRGQTVADDAEVTWRDSETRSFAQVVDGITKLASDPVGVPVEALLPDVPGWSKQRVDQVRSAIEQRRAAPPNATPGELGAATNEATDAKAQADALGSLIRAGVDPESAAARLGLKGLTFTGAVPVSLRLPEVDAADLEQG